MSQTWIGFVIIAVVALVIWVAVAKAKRQRERRARIFAEARAFMADVEKSRILPTVGSNVLLKSGENAFYSAPSALYETKAVRHYQAGHSGFRVAKGVYVGTTSGRSTSTQEWSRIDTGRLTVTNKRLIFDGGSQERTVQLSKIVSVEQSPTGIEVSVEGRQKRMVFEAANPLILASIIHICCQAEDPRDLSQTALNINFAA
jgi:hypothetical protein